MSLLIELSCNELEFMQTGKFGNDTLNNNIGILDHRLLYISALACASVTVYGS